jgi:hypothetical protein
VLTSLVHALLQVKDEDPEDAEDLSPMNALLSYSIKTVIMSSLATADDASDLAVAVLEAYGYKDVTSLEKNGCLDNLDMEYYQGAAFSGDCMLLIGFYSSDCNLDSEADKLLDII